MAKKRDVRERIASERSAFVEVELGRALLRGCDVEDGQDHGAGEPCGGVGQVLT